MVDQLQDDFSKLKIEGEYVINKTGLTYDPIMLDFHCLFDPTYPEMPDRILKPYERCQFYNLVEKCVDIKGRFATDEEIELMHTKRVNELMKKSETMKYDELVQLSREYDGVYWHVGSNKAARWALGSSLELLDSIMTGKVQNGFAIIRPPGHHAMVDEPNGYCYFNNSAICAKHAIENYKLKRILIVDWDVHHGQGIQRMFYDDPKVLYFSLHRYDFGEYWPFLRESDFDYIGEGDGRGYNINVPLNKTGFCNWDYMAVFYNILLPIAYEFNPELVIVSSGYDSCIGCYDGRMKVTPSCYAHLINLLSCFANGKLCVLLEGGYCIKSLSEGVALTLRSLLGYPCPRLEDFQQPDPMIVEVINNLKAVLRPYWCCLQSLNETSTIQLNDYLKKFEERRKNIKFINEENRPKEFKITGFYQLYSDEENELLNIQIDELIKNTDLSVPQKKTCFCTNDKMSQNRLLTVKGIYEKCEQLKSRAATEDEIGLCYSHDYINSKKKLKDKSKDELLGMTKNSDSVCCNWDSFECASINTGCLLNVVEAVCTQKFTNGAAIMRPNEQHAFQTRESGFCFINSIAIAAKYAQKNFNRKKILIVDFNAHHENEPQDIFKDDDSVLFISLHRFDKEKVYETHNESNYDNFGNKNAKGRTINIPWNDKSVGDAEYVHVFLQIVMPIAYEFNPDLVLVSICYDGLLNDPLGAYKMAPASFAHMCKMLMGLAYGNVIVTIEGDCNLTYVSDCISTCISVLLGNSCPEIESLIPKKEASSSIRKVVSTLKPYWKYFQFEEKLPMAECVKKYKATLSEE